MRGSIGEWAAEEEDHKGEWVKWTDGRIYDQECEGELEGLGKSRRPVIEIEVELSCENEDRRGMLMGEGASSSPPVF